MKRSRAWLEAGCVAVVLAMGWPLVAGRLFAGTDTRRLAMSALPALQAAVRDGELLVWRHDLFAGFHAIGGGTSQALYPPHLLLLAAGLSPETAWRVSMLLHLWLLARGVAAAAGALGASRRAALVAAAVATVGGVTATHCVWLEVGVALGWTGPILWLAARCARDERGWRALAGLAAVWGVAGLGGHPPYLWYAALTSLVLAAAVSPPTARGVARGLLRAGSAGALGVLLAGAYLLPMVAFARENPRGSAEMPLAEWLGAAGLRLEGLVRLVLPEAWGTPEDGTWTGDPQAIMEAQVRAGGALVVLALARLAAGRLDALARGGLALAVGGLLLSPPSDATPLHRLMLEVPPFSLFRIPARYLWLTQLGAALLAASAIDALLRGGLACARARAGAVAGGLVHLAAACVALAVAPVHLLRLGTLLPLASAGLAVAAVLGRRRAWAALLVGLALAELAAGRARMMPSVDQAELVRPPALLAPALASPQRRTFDALLEPEPSWTCEVRVNAGARWGLEYFNGYDSVPPRPQLFHEAQLHSLRRTDPPGFVQACREWSIAWVIDRQRLPGLEAVAEDRGVHLLRVPDPRPMAYAVPPGAQVEAGVVDTRGARTSPVELLEGRRGRWRLRADGPCVLVVAQAWDLGWEVTVDGAPAATCVADMLQLAVPLGPGRHEVRLTHVDPWVEAGLLLSASAWLGLGTAVWLARRREG